MRRLVRYWAVWGLLKQQQQGQGKQRMLLLLVIMVACCIGISASAFLCCPSSTISDPAITAFIRVTSPWPVFRATFLVPASSNTSADKTNILGKSLSLRHAGCRRMNKQAASGSVRHEGLIKAYCSQWAILESDTHTGSHYTPRMPLRPPTPLTGATMYGGPLTLFMRAHVRRPHSRLGRPQSHRKALLRNLATQLIRHGSIITTAAKGRELRRVIDSKIVLAKKGGLHNYRQALGFFYDKKLTRSLFQQAPTRFARRNNGFCRCTLLPFPRLGDAAKICRVELLD